MKFFPAEASGGAGLPQGGQRRRCRRRGSAPPAASRPTNAPGYLALPNVGCVGGSWITPADALEAGDWDRVADLARAAAAL